MPITIIAFTVSILMIIFIANEKLRFLMAIPGFIIVLVNIVIRNSRRIIETGDDKLVEKKGKSTSFRLPNGPYKIEKAKTDDIKWITIKAKEIYGRQSIPFSIKIEWFKKFPEGFWIIKDGNNKNIGSLEFFPVKDIIIIKLKEKKLIEKEISADDIYSIHEIQNAKYFYLENLMLLDKDNQPDQFAFVNLLRFSKNILNSFDIANNDEVYLYALSIENYKSKLGKNYSNSSNLLRKFGFNELSQSKQKLPIFYIKLSDFIKQINKYKKKCTL